MRGVGHASGGRSVERLTIVYRCHALFTLPLERFLRSSAWPWHAARAETSSLYVCCGRYSSVFTCARRYKACLSVP